MKLNEDQAIFFNNAFEQIMDRLKSHGEIGSKMAMLIIDKEDDEGVLHGDVPFIYKDVNEEKKQVKIDEGAAHIFNKIKSVMLKQAKKTKILIHFQSIKTEDNREYVVRYVQTGKGDDKVDVIIDRIEDKHLEVGDNGDMEYKFKLVNVATV